MSGEINSSAAGAAPLDQTAEAKLREAEGVIARLASAEAFVVARALDFRRDDELIARLAFAREYLRRTHPGAEASRQSAYDAMLRACKAVLRMRVVCPEDVANEVEMCREAVVLAARDDADEKAGLTQAAEGSELLRLKSLNAELNDGLVEAVLQIEYLHEKFQETGSGNAALARIRSLLSRTT